MCVDAKPYVGPARAVIYPELEPGRPKQFEAERIGTVEIVKIPIAPLFDLSEDPGEAHEGPGMGVVDTGSEVSGTVIVRQELHLPGPDLPVDECVGVTQPLPHLITVEVEEPLVFVGDIGESR